MEGLAHTHTSLRSQNNSHNGTAAAAATAVTLLNKEEPKIWWEQVNDEKNIIPVGQEGQDWEGGRLNIVQVVSSIPKTTSSSSFIIYEPIPSNLVQIRSGRVVRWDACGCITILCY